jgi:hypothetical protein
VVPGRNAALHQQRRGFTTRIHLQLEKNMDGMMMPAQAEIPPRQTQVKERWTDQEIAIIRRTYPMSGAPGCQEVMPYRSLSSIYNQAAALKIKHGKSKPARQSWTTTEQIDAAIIRVYQSDPTKGQLALLCVARCNGPGIGCAAGRWRWVWLLRARRSRSGRMLNFKSWKRSRTSNQRRSSVA